MKIEMIYEDEHIIALNKPADVLTIPDRFDPTLPNLKDYLLSKHTEIFVVHRLDKETSGIILFAKSADAHKQLSEAFQGGEIEKYYWALTIKPYQDSGIIEENIAESEKKGKYKVAKKGKYSLSEYQVLESYNKYALVQIRIHTGRTHQIRVHMKHNHSPLLVDSKYGAMDAFYLSQIKKYKRKKEVEERPLISRCSLHARQLILTHPVTGESLDLTAELPKDMRATINQLKKTYA